MFDVPSLERLAKAMEGIPVLGVLPGSAAARAGVLYGDVLLEVNGVRVKCWGDYVFAKSQRAEEGTEVVVFRAGESRRLRIEPAARANASPDYYAIVAEMAVNRLGGARLDDDELRVAS